MAPALGSDGNPIRVQARIWNANGSEAALSGNGLITLAHAAAREHGLRHATVVVEIGGEEHIVKIYQDLVLL